MATKMNAETAKRVKALNINAKNEEEARESLLAILNENGIEGMEEEDTDTLIEIAESFVEEGAAAPEAPEADDANDDANDDADEDALAEEVEAEEAAEETAEETDEGDQFDAMDRTALKNYIKEQGLDIKVKKSWSDDVLRDEIRKATAEDAKPEAEEEKETAPAAPAKKAEKKETVKKADKAPKAEKAEKKVGKRGTKIDPKNNEEDRKVFDCLHELFPEDEYIYAWVSSAGVTIKHRGKNSQRAMVLIENCSRQADDSIKCNLYLLTFTKQTAVLDEAGIEYEICWSNAPFMKGITLDEAVNIITTLMPHITATVQKIDKRLGENRAKMEESLAKKSAPAPAKKTAPATKKAAAPVAKKTVKK